MEMRAAAVQLNSTADKALNLETAERLVRAAASAGATLVVLPEKWNLLGDAATLSEGAEPLDGPTIRAASAWARELGIHLVAGSIAERVEGHEKAFNTSALIGPDGELEYRNSISPDAVKRLYYSALVFFAGIKRVSPKRFKRRAETAKWIDKFRLQIRANFLRTK